MGKDDVTAAEAEAVNKRAEATAVLMVKPAALTRSHTPQDQTLLCYTRASPKEARGARGLETLCLATQACQQVLSHSSGIFPQGNSQTSPQNCRNKDVRWSGCSQHQDEEAALEKHLMMEPNWLTWKPMRLHRGQVLHAPSVTPLSSEIRGTSPFQTEGVHLCWGWCTGRGRGGWVVLMAPWAETGTPAFHQSCITSHQARIRGVWETTAALRTGTAEREGKEAGMMRIWPHGSPGKSSPVRGFPMLRWASTADWQR